MKKIIQNSYQKFILRGNLQCVADSSFNDVRLFLPEIVTMKALIDTIIHEDLHYVMINSYGWFSEKRQHNAIKRMEIEWF